MLHYTNFDYVVLHHVQASSFEIKIGHDCIVDFYMMVIEDDYVE